MKKEMEKNWKKAPFIVLLVLAGIAALVAVLMLLWNAILPDVIGVTTITYWQALGILVMSKILFGGLGKGSMKNRKGKAKFKQKFMHMSDEEKASFKSEWKSRCAKE